MSGPDELAKLTLPSARIALLAVAALACCAAPDIEGPPPQPTPLYDITEGELSPASPGGAEDGEPDAAMPRPSPDQGRRPACEPGGPTETIDVGVGETARTRTGLAVTYEGVMHDSAADSSGFLVSLSFRRGSHQDTWLASATADEGRARILDHCVRIAGRHAGRIQLEVSRP